MPDEHRVRTSPKTSATRGRAEAAGMPIAAVSGDAILLQILRDDALTATVHSVFESVLNLCTRSNELVSLAARHLDNAPNTLVLDTTSMRSLRAMVGARVTSTAHQLRSDAFTIYVANAAEWRAELPDLSMALARDPGTLIRGASELRRLLATDGREGGIVPRPDGGSLSNQLARQLATATEHVMSGLRQGDLAASTTWISRLVGLGPGLTPSGDDFITGLAVTLAVPSTRMHQFSPWLGDVIQGFEMRTNLISWTTMSEAARGRARESILGLLHAVASGDRATVEAATQTVLDIGKTSGTDIVAGVQAALELENHLNAGA